MGIDIEDIRRQQDGTDTDSSCDPGKDTQDKPATNMGTSEAKTSPTSKGKDMENKDIPPSSSNGSKSTTSDKIAQKPTESEQCLPSKCTSGCVPSENEETPIIDKPIKHVSEEEAKTKLDFERNYKMTSLPRGLAIIINIENYGDTGLNRTGSSSDVINLAILFNRLGFRVDLWINYTAEQIQNKIHDEQSADYHKDYDAFVMVVMAHGYEGTIKAADHVYLNIMEDIVKPFNGNRAKTLMDKPKLFFIQTCRGGPEQLPRSSNLSPRQQIVLSDAAPQAEVSGDEVPKAIEMADMLVVYATTEGSMSYRNRVLGAFFIRDLVTVFTERCHEDHLLDMVTEVTRKVKNRTIGPDGQNRQLCSMSGQLDRKLFFLPGYHQKPEPEPVQETPESEPSKITVISQNACLPTEEERMVMAEGADNEERST